MTWKTVKLGEVCEVFADGDWIETKDQSPGGIRLIQTGNIKSGYFVDRLDKARFISETTFLKLKCTEVLEGDLLVSRLPDPVGRACLIPELKHKSITAVDCTIIRPSRDILPHFMNYVMCSRSYFNSVANKVTGATRKRISRKNLGEIEIPLPPLAEQERIVAKLNAAFAAIDQGIALAEKKEAEVEQLKAALLSASLAGDDWKTVKLGEVLSIARGGSPRPIKSYLTNEEDGVNWIKIGDTEQGGKYISSTKEKIKPSGVSRSRLVKEGDFLLSNSMSFGRPYILKIDGCIHDGWLVLSDYGKKFVREFLYYLLSSTVVKDQFEFLARGSTVRNLNIGLVSGVQIPLPPLAEQERIVAKLDAAFAELETARTAIAETKANYQALKAAILAQELQPKESEAA